MNKAVMVAIVVVVVLLGGAGAWVAMSNKGLSPSPAANTTVNVGVQAETVSGKSMKELIALGTPQECVFKDDADNGGLVLVANGKMRGEFSSKGPDGQSLDSHMIVDGQTVFVWMDGETTGFKIVLEGMAQSAGEKTNVDVDRKIDFSCKAWSVDAIRFDLPNGITFTDMGSVIAPSGGVMNKCDACNEAPEGAKAQCLAALGCN